LDRLIQYVNDNTAKYNITVQYGTFTDYVAAVHIADLTWQVEGPNKDFMTYVSAHRINGGPYVSSHHGFCHRTVHSTITACMHSVIASLQSVIPQQARFSTVSMVVLIFHLIMDSVIPPQVRFSTASMVVRVFHVEAKIKRSDPKRGRVAAID
jgi:hypothetical protein